MAIEADEMGASRTDHRVGQDLYALSIDELRIRIAALQDEIARIQREIDAKSAHKTAASAAFKF